MQVNLIILYNIISKERSIKKSRLKNVLLHEYVRKLKECKVSIFFEKEEFDTANEEGEVLLTVYCALAQEELKDILME